MEQPAPHGAEDYHQLNLQTVEDKYPLPNIADLAARLDGCKLLSKLDLCKGYLQVLVAVEDVAKTVIWVIRAHQHTIQFEEHRFDYSAAEGFYSG
jgi:hypothetical protein